MFFVGFPRSFTPTRSTPSDFLSVSTRLVHSTNSLSSMRLLRRRFVSPVFIDTRSSKTKTKTRDFKFVKGAEENNLSLAIELGAFKFFFYYQIAMCPTGHSVNLSGLTAK